jgi:ABC-type sugar transport system ATPase subunit
MVAAVPRVQLTGLCKRYPGVRALDGVGFAIQAGHVHALVGENGAGKSTLVKLLGGVARPDAGEILVDGGEVRLRGARDAWDAGIAVVFQDFNLAGDLSVAENVFLGRWPRTRSGFVDFTVLHARAAALFEQLGVEMSVRRTVRGLSVAEQQMVEIARALSLDAAVLILDEPSAVLTPKEVAMLFRIVRTLTARGVSVLYVSHRLDEIFALCDSVTVLRDGRHVSTRPIGEVDRDLLIHEMVGRSIQEEFPARAVDPGETVLCAVGLSAANRFKNVSFELHRGEVFALTGLVGSGRSSIGKSLFGTVQGVEGELELLGSGGGVPSSPRMAKRRGIALVPEDRRRQGLLLERPVRENLSLANLRGVSWLGVLSAERERSAANRWMQELRIKAAGVDAVSGTLSGGNQQKVLIGRWLQRPCRVMILDEPTRGVDVGAKVEIYSIINQLAARGTAVLLITSEFAEAVGMADRIGVMAGGQLTGILENRGRDVTQEEILRLSVPRTSSTQGLAREGIDP